MDAEQFMSYVTGFFGVPEQAWELRAVMDDTQGAILIQLSVDHSDVEVLRRVKERVEEALVAEVGE